MFSSARNYKEAGKLTNELKQQTELKVSLQTREATLSEKIQQLETILADSIALLNAAQQSFAAESPALRINFSVFPFL